VPNKKRTELLSRKITKEEYETIFKKAVETIESFKFPKKSHLLRDGTHYELKLKINRQPLSVRYESVDSLEKTSKSLYDIIKMTRKYLKINKTSQQSPVTATIKKEFTISAEITEENYNKTKTIIVSKKPQEVYSHHASTTNGGLYVEVTIQTEGKYVKIHQSASIANGDKPIMRTIFT